MGHYRTDAGAKAEAETPAEWYGVGKQIADLANEWARRGDIVAFVGEGAGGPAPACFIPATAEIEVNTDVAFGVGANPEFIDLTTRRGRYDYPRAVGAIIHEAGHAAHSCWSQEDAYKALKRDEYEALMLLEESRIEARILASNPRHLPFLHACAMEIVIADAGESFASQSNTQAAATLVGLVYARVDAGILNLRDVVEVTNLIDDYLGLDVVSRLREIAMAAQAHTNDTNATAMYPLAIEWAQLVRDTAEEKGDAAPESGEGGEGGTGESGEGGEGGSGGAMSEFVKALSDALDGAAEEVGISAEDALEDAETRERYEEVVKERSSKSREVADNKGQAGKAFGGKGSGVVNTGRSHSSLIQTRPPKGDERSAAVRIASLLEKAKYRERDVTEVSSAVPSGRLRPRTAMQGAAQKARGMMVDVEPWRRKVRKHTDEPTLTVGVMVDISGSMGSAMEPMATVAYVMAEAGHRVQAKSAMIYYGNDVFPTLHVGERPTAVKVFSAPDGTERFDDAFRSLDGELDLLWGTGARLLFIVSDGEYTATETDACKRWMRRCEEQGVAVVWLPFDEGNGVRRVAGKSATMVTGRLNPTTAAMAIGQACADAIGEVGRRNA